MHDARIGMRQYAVANPVTRKGLLEIDRQLMHRRARIDIQDQGAHALRTGIQPQKQSGHKTLPFSVRVVGTVEPAAATQSRNKPARYKTEPAV